MADTKPRTAGEGRRLTSWDDNLDSRATTNMRERAYRIRKMQQDAVVEVGRQLLAAKGQVEHGSFVAFIQSACQMHIRTAERAMQAAQMIEENDKVSYLPPDGLLALAALSVPEGAKAKIVEEINAGAKPTAAEIKRQIKTAKAAHKRAAAQQSGGPDSSGQHEQAAEEVAASKAVNLLYECLGDQFDVFLALFDKAGDRFGEAVRQRRTTFAEASPWVDAEGEPSIATPAERPMSGRCHRSRSPGTSSTERWAPRLLTSGHCGSPPPATSAAVTAVDASVGPRTAGLRRPC